MMFIVVDEVYTEPTTDHIYSQPMTEQQIYQIIMFNVRRELGNMIYENDLEKQIELAKVTARKCFGKF